MEEYYLHLPFYGLVAFPTWLYKPYSRLEYLKVIFLRFTCPYLIKNK